jgi:hypothetical protein
MVGTQRSHQTTHRRLLPPWRSPPPAWASHLLSLADLYRQPGRPHQEGRSTRTPHATSLTSWSDGHVAEVRQVHVDRLGNEDA